MQFAAQFPGCGLGSSADEQGIDALKCHLTRCWTWMKTQTHYSESMTSVVYLKAVKEDHVSCFIPLFTANIGWAVCFACLASVGKQNQHEKWVIASFPRSKDLNRQRAQIKPQLLTQNRLNLMEKIVLLQNEILSIADWRAENRNWTIRK